jgi:hypothetical protein
VGAEPPLVVSGEQLPVLPGARADVERVVRGHLDVHGYDEATGLLNLTRSMVVSKLQEVCKEPGGDDRLLVYFSCHGHKEEDGEGLAEFHLCMADTTPAL